MRPLYRNIFFFLGLAAVVVMLLSFDMDYTEVWHHIRRAGYWFVAVVGIWVVIYLFNTLSWYTIIRNGGEKPPISFLRLYKLTVSGFALNYATPCGLMGGEPYRIMELTPALGVSRATSSVILYVMMHIFSHVCFWFGAVVLYILMYTPDVWMWMMLGAVAAFCLLAIYFFMRGYRFGLVIKTLRWASHLPWAGRYAQRLLDEKHDRLLQIDHQIAELHQQHRATFYKAFFYEFCARVLTAAEIFFILHILTNDVNFLNCILIMAFTSLFGNLFFFSPMQLGAREGGFALSVSALQMSAAFGVYTSLITRVRELIWIVIGLLLMRIANQAGPGVDVQVRQVGPGANVQVRQAGPGANMHVSRSANKDIFSFPEKEAKGENR